MKTHKLTSAQKAFLEHAKGNTEYSKQYMGEKGFKYPKAWQDTVKVLVREGIVKIEDGCVIEINEAKTNIKEGEILCRSCAAYASCKLEKRGNALKCRNFWEHISTFDFVK